MTLLFADYEILARTVYGEARGETYKGKKAVAHVMINRWRSTTGQFKRDDTLATACLRHLQFSCWDAIDEASRRNLERMLSVPPGDPVFRECYRAGLEAFDEADFTNGATHYHTKDILPAWAVGRVPCFGEGKHVFYNDVP